MSDIESVRDLLYLDFPKAASIWSQLDEGLLERTSTTNDTTKSKSGGLEVGLRGVVSGRGSTDYADKRSVMESRTLHHNLLSQVEEALMSSGLAVDMSEAVQPDETSIDTIRAALKDFPYIKAGGVCVFEDYQRIRSRTESFNSVVDVIRQASEDTIRKSDEFRALNDSIAEARTHIATIKDRNERAVEKSKIDALQKQIDGLAKQPVSGIDDWLVNGVKLWIDTYMPNRLHLRVYPLVNCPTFQVLCNLKRECFVDSDLEHLLYGFGHLPNVPLEILGVVTSAPPREEPSFNPLREFEDSESLGNREIFEKAFRGVFAGMEHMEAMMRFSRYPNITVHPIAVYRTFRVRRGAR